MKNPFCWNQALFMAVLNPIHRIAGGITETQRDRLLMVCMLLLMPIYIIRISPSHPWFVPLTETQWDIIGCIILFAAAIFSQKGDLRLLVPNNWFCLAYYLPPLFIILAGFLHPISAGFLPFSLILIFGFPCLYFVWANRGDFEVLFRIFSWALVIGGFVFIALNVLFYSADSFANGKFVGITPNPNTVGEHLAMSLIGAFYLYFTESRKRLFPLVLFICIFMGMLVTSQSRTAGLSVATIFIAGALFEIARKKGDKQELAGFLKRIALLVGLCLIGVLLILVMFVMGNDFANRQADLLQSQWGRLISFVQGGITLEQFSSERTGIWKLFFDGLTIFGKDFNAAPIIWNGQYFGAHNTFLEFGYRCGILAGASYLLFGLFSLAMIFRSHAGKTDQYFLFTCMSTIIFFIYSMLEVPNTPFYYGVIICFFVGIGPRLFQNKGKQNE
jgi:hypothetical protein